VEVTDIAEQSPESSEILLSAWAESECGLVALTIYAENGELQVIDPRPPAEIECPAERDVIRVRRHLADHIGMGPGGKSYRVIPEVIVEPRVASRPHPDSRRTERVIAIVRLIP
jgi:hypothetical protein